MKLIKRLCGVLGILFLIAFVFYSYRNYKVNEYMDNGITNAKNGQYEKAIECFNDVVKIDDDNKLAKKSIEEMKEYLLADDLYLKGKIDEAKEEVTDIIKSGVDWDKLREDIDELEEKIKKIENKEDETINRLEGNNIKEDLEEGEKSTEGIKNKLNELKEEKLTKDKALKLIEKEDSEFLKKLLSEKYYEEKPRIWCDLNDNGEKGKGLYNGINIFNLPIKNGAYIFYVNGDYTLGVYIVDKTTRDVYRMPNQGGGTGYLIKKDKIIKEYPAIK